MLTKLMKIKKILFINNCYYYSFTNTQLFGLAPELSPVYHHILWKWRNYKGDKYKTQPYTNMNGLNSGVILSYLERIRKSAEYDRLISPEWISGVVQKYLFKVSVNICYFWSLVYDWFMILRDIWVIKIGTLW